MVYFHTEDVIKYYDKLEQNCLQEFLGLVPWVDPGESFISVRAKTDGLSKEKPSSISGWLLGWATWLKKGVWAKRCSTLFAGNEFSDAEVAANVLAANGWEGRKVHANCSLDLRWTSAHEWASRLLKKYCCTTRACWWKIQCSLSPGTLVLRLFSWAWPCGIILRESASMPQSLSGRTAGAEKGSAASGSSGTFTRRSAITYTVCPWRKKRVKNPSNMPEEVATSSRFSELWWSSIPVPERSFFFYTNFTKSVSTRLHYLKNKMHRLQFLGRFQFPIFWKCDLPIQIFVNSDFLSKNYNWTHIQTKIYANFNENVHNKINY